MFKGLCILLFLIVIYIMIIAVKSEDKTDEITKKINYCSEQGYNISDSNDKFFTDICAIFYSDTKKDVSLEYRIRHYYFPFFNRSNNIILNASTLPEIKRNNIFLCFEHHLNALIIIYNIALYIIIIVFIIQIVLFLFTFIGDYKNASKNNSQKYLSYLKEKKEKFDKKKNKTNLISSNSEANANINNNNDFIRLNEETQNNEEIPKNCEHSEIIGQNQIELETLHTENVNTSNEINEKNEKEQNKNNILPQKRDTFTFGDILVPINVNNEEPPKDEVKDYDKKEIEAKIFHTINDNPIKKFKKEIKNENILSPDELFYCDYKTACHLDKRTLMKIYYDILSHCQIIFLFCPNFFIYEDIDIIILYYFIKLQLYFIVNILLLNSNYVINSIYDNRFSIYVCLKKCLFATIIVNIISQILFRFTNSKKQFITHINNLKKKLKHIHLFYYSLEEIILIINNNLYEKLINLCVLNVLIFIIAFYCSLCFCSTYFYTQFIVLKNIIICIIISQSFPFLLAFIPAIFRKKSLEVGEENINIQKDLKNKSTKVKNNEAQNKLKNENSNKLDENNNSTANEKIESGKKRENKSDKNNNENNKNSGKTKRKKKRKTFKDLLYILNQYINKLYVP